MPNATVIHFGIKIEGTEPNIRFYDNSLATNYDLTIPAGTYYYSDPDSTKDIVDVINSLISGLGSSPGWSRAFNGKQLELNADASDLFYLLDTDDLRSLSDALGFYDENNYTDTTGFANGDVTQVTKASFYCDCGYVYNTRNNYGAPNFGQIDLQARGGAITTISSEKVDNFNPVFTVIAGQLVDNNEANLEYQTVYKTTILTDPIGAYLWVAYDPRHRAPRVSIEFATLDNEEYYLKPIKKEDLTPYDLNQNTYYDLQLRLSVKKD